MSPRHSERRLGIAVKPFEWPYPPGVTFGVDSRLSEPEAVTGREAGGCCSASPAWGFEQGGDLSDGFGTRADVPHRGARVAVPGLGHDQLQGDALFTEVGGC